MTKIFIYDYNFFHLALGLGRGEKLHENHMQINAENEDAGEGQMKTANEN